MEPPPPPAAMCGGAIGAEDTAEAAGTTAIEVEMTTGPEAAADAAVEAIAEASEAATPPPPGPGPEETRLVARAEVVV